MPLRKTGLQGQGRDDDYYNSPNMDPHRIGRSPSPGHPLNHGYQLEDAPAYGHQVGPGRLDIPMGPGTGRHTPSDRLQAQPTVSPTCIQNHTQIRPAIRITDNCLL
jgi:chitin synthase